ncbi:MAG: hypothetical protein ACJAUV_001823 [Flavobacteriales bacterium]
MVYFYAQPAQPLSMKKSILFLSSLLLVCTTVKSQISYEERIELELKDGYENEKIISFGSHGFILSAKNSKSSGKEIEWKYDKYDVNLQATETKKILLGKKLTFEASYTDEHRTHSFYKDRKGNYSLITIEASNLEVATVTGLLPRKATVFSMSVLGDYVFLEVYIKNSPLIVSVNWKTGEHKTIPILIDNVSSKKTRLKDFQLLKGTNELFMYVSAEVEKKKSDVYVVSFNANGEKKEIFNLTKGIDKNLVDISCSKVADDTYIYTGTYATNNAYSSEGIFFCQAKKGKVDYIKFYNYLDLKNFLSYLPEKKQEKIEKKKKRKEKKGKDYSLSYKIAAHEVTPLDDGYLFLGEAYYPTYRTVTYTTTPTSNGVASTSTQTRLVFDGFQYTHAMLGKFDKAGSLVWDQTFDMWSSYKPYSVRNLISIAEKNQNSLKLVFASHNKITAKSFDFDGTVIQENQSDEIKTPNKEDKTKYTLSAIDFWYDNYFIAYGKQKIINKDSNRKTKRKREVYFISKIKFE